MRTFFIFQWKFFLNGVLLLESEGCECFELDLFFQFFYDVLFFVFLFIVRRLVKYQEADFEEEEMVFRGSSLFQRGSIGSYQSVYIMYRIQSIKTYRRTGSRAEVKRVSMLFKYTVFSSFMVSLLFFFIFICRIYRKCLCLVI